MAKEPWPYADDEWIVIAAMGTPKRVHRLRKWANGVVDVACGAMPSLVPGRRIVFSKGDHERGDWSEVLRLPRCTKCWPGTPPWPSYGANLT